MLDMIFKGNPMKDVYKEASKIIKNSKNLIALTGAGISVSSGIPDFRSPGGLWEKYDTMEYAHIDSFKKNPGKVWKLLYDMYSLASSAKPNPAHLALAELEKMKILKAVITQNIDNLHQEAGSVNVIEFHGNGSKLVCLQCSSTYSVHDIVPEENNPPKCPECGRILKPNIVLFGEMIPPGALLNSQRLAEEADAIMVIATSAIVYPASNIPYIAGQKGAKVIEMNMEETGLTSSITDVFIKGRIEETLPELLKYIKK